MISIGTFVELGILWFFIVLFTGSIDEDQGYREAFKLLGRMRTLFSIFALCLALIGCTTTPRDVHAV